jgi:hypothetical protein
MLQMISTMYAQGVQRLQTGRLLILTTNDQLLAELSELSSVILVASSNK